MAVQCQGVNRRNCPECRVAACCNTRRRHAEYHIGGKSPAMATAIPNFRDIQEKCFLEGKLYEDPSFPARSTSINPDADNPGDWLWKRPKELCEIPKLVFDGAKKFDLSQGELADPWFVAAAAVLVTRKEAFQQVIIPSTQNFRKTYAGIFRFNIWRFGQWEEVIIDDRLPVTPSGELRFVRNNAQPNEFWAPLLHKAYAKLHGSYSAIKAGQVSNALVDLTAGLSETYDLRQTDKLPLDLFDIINKSYKAGSLFACNIWGPPGDTKVEKMWNGLFKGHAYTITGVLENRIKGWSVKLLRMRNPAGEGGWTGAWGEKSDEWMSLTKEERKNYGLKYWEAGEFWMTFDDLVTQFHSLDVIHLSSTSFSKLAIKKSPDKIKWRETIYHAKWLKGVTAGGSGLLGPSKDLYYTNPQYSVQLEEPDLGDVSGECTCVVSVMQKTYKRKKSSQQCKSVIMGIDIHLAKDSKPERLDAQTYFNKAQLKKQYQNRIPMREVACRLLLDPGIYYVVPNTLRAGQEADFLIRIFTYGNIETKSFEIEKTEFVEPNNFTDRPIGAFSNDMFLAFVEDDFVVDARDLRDLLSQLSKNDFQDSLAFGLEACRSLVAMMDTENTTGILDYAEVAQLWDELLHWKNIFKQFDKDKSGFIETYELRSIFIELGFRLSLDTVSMMAVRYGGKDRTMSFEDFALCLCRTITLHRAFVKNCQCNVKDGCPGLDKWLKATIPL